MAHCKLFLLCPDRTQQPTAKTSIKLSRQLRPANICQNHFGNQQKGFKMSIIWWGWWTHQSTTKGAFRAASANIAHTDPPLNIYTHICDDIASSVDCGQTLNKNDYYLVCWIPFLLLIVLSFSFWSCRCNCLLPISPPQYTVSLVRWLWLWCICCCELYPSVVILTAFAWKGGWP